MWSSEAEFNNYNLIPSSIMDYTKVCFWTGSGDMISSLGLSSSLTDVTKYTSSFDSLEKYTNPSDPAYIDTSRLNTGIVTT